MSYILKNTTLYAWIEEVVVTCQPDSVHWCDGSTEEYDRLMANMVARESAIALKKRPHCFLFRSDPSDVARVEDRTYISTRSREDAGPTDIGAVGNLRRDPFAMKPFSGYNMAD